MKQKQRRNLMDVIGLVGGAAIVLGFLTLMAFH
jgi:hypothetical protein